MTKEPIMIDDVDVSGCKAFYINAAHPELKQCINPYCKDLCKDNPNCYYKQLKRKEQECEWWKRQAELGSDTTDRLAKQLEEKEQELDECREKLHKQLNQLKADNDKLKQYKASKQASYETMQREWNKAKNEVKQLKAENKELKTEVDKFEEQIKLQGNFIDSFLFATKNSEWRNKSILEDEADAIIEKVEADYVQLEEYKQALEEIKEIAENAEEQCAIPENYFKRNNVSWKQHQLRGLTCKFKQILQKISEVEDV